MKSFTGNIARTIGPIHSSYFTLVLSYRSSPMSLDFRHHPWTGLFRERKLSKRNEYHRLRFIRDPHFTVPPRNPLCTERRTSRLYCRREKDFSGYLTGCVSGDVTDGSVGDEMCWPTQYFVHFREIVARRLLSGTHRRHLGRGEPFEKRFSYLENSYGDYNTNVR